MNPSTVRTRLRLFCLPHAGAGASRFADWAAAFPADVDVAPIQLPGRENLLSQPACADAATLVELLGPALAEAADQPFVLFGHSMGALLAAELTGWLHQAGAALPELLVVSGRTGRPGPAGDPARWLTMPEDDLVAATLRGGGTTAEVFADPELRALVVTALRHDFALCEGYAPGFDVLPVPLLVLGGTTDATVPLADLLAWSEHTTFDCDVHLLAGGHFFPYGQVDRVAELVLTHPALAR